MSLSLALPALQPSVLPCLCTSSLVAGELSEMAGRGLKLNSAITVTNLFNRSVGGSGGERNDLCFVIA